MTLRANSCYRVCAILALASETLVGCTARVPASVPHGAIARTQSLGSSVEGRDIECVVIGEGSIRVMFIATIHGDEPAGTPLLETFIQKASTNPGWMANRTLIVVPIANPDGFESNRRGNANNVDLNRNFPAASFTSRRRHGENPLSEPESQALHDAILEHRPHRIVSIHQPLDCIDYDGDGASLARALSHALAEEFRLPVRKLGAMPGSLGSFAGEDLNIPTITIEFDRHAHRLSSEELWKRFGGMLIVAVEWP